MVIIVHNCNGIGKNRTISNFDGLNGTDSYIETQFYILPDFYLSVILRGDATSKKTEIIAYFNVIRHRIAQQPDMGPSQDLGFAAKNGTF